MNSQEFVLLAFNNLSFLVIISIFLESADFDASTTQLLALSLNEYRNAYIC